MAQVKLLYNTPVNVNDAKYLDCIPGEYGHQLRIKGTIDDQPNSVIYLPGRVWAAKKVLIEAGVIGEDDFDEEPKEALNIPLLMKSFYLENKQVKGKNYGQLHVYDSAGVPKDTQNAPQTTKGKNAGPLLPEEEEGYLDALTGQEQGPVNVPPPPSFPMESVGKLYLECMKYVVDRIVPLWEAGEVKYDASALNAATATLMIQRGKR